MRLALDNTNWHGFLRYLSLRSVLRIPGVIRMRLRVRGTYQHGRLPNIEPLRFPHAHFIMKSPRPSSY